MCSSDLNERLRQQGQPPLVVGVGIHTGEVVLGHVGGATHQEYTAIGAVVNMATRLEDLTRTLPYPVICSAPVADAVGRAGGLQDLGVQPLREQAPIAVFGWHPPLSPRSAVEPVPPPQPAPEART